MTNNDKIHTSESQVKTYINGLSTTNDVETCRKMLNEMCDARNLEIMRNEKADALSKKSFSYIKECFEAISPELFKTAKGKKIINKYSKLVRENHNLSMLHAINENIRKANGNTDVDYFMNSLVETKWNINNKTLANDTKKIGDVLAEAYLYIGDNVNDMLPNENVSLSKAISFIAENKKNTKNILEFSDAVKIIKEHINSNTVVDNISEAVDLDEMAEKLIKEFNAKYEGKLSEKEIAILKEISSSNDREAVFNKYKASCAQKISEAKSTFDVKGDKASSDRLGLVLERISEKKYSSETVGSDICSLIELTNIFD